jgi:hypothetical protein
MTTKNTYQLLLKAVQSLWNIHTNSSWRLCKVYEKYTPPHFEDCAKSIKNTYQLLLKTMQSLWKIHTNSSWRLCKVYEKYISTLLEGCAKSLQTIMTGIQNSFIYSLFHDAIKNFHYTVFSSRMTSSTGKDLEGSNHGILCNMVTIKPKSPKCLFYLLCFQHKQVTLPT